MVDVAEHEVERPKRSGCNRAEETSARLHQATKETLQR
jgi:hypothetical protein